MGGGWSSLSRWVGRENFHYTTWCCFCINKKQFYFLLLKKLIWWDIELSRFEVWAKLCPPEIWCEEGEREREWAACISSNFDTKINETGCNVIHQVGRCVYTGVDVLLILNEQQFYSFGPIQNSQTGGQQLHSDTSPYDEFYLASKKYLLLVSGYRIFGGRLGFESVQLLSLSKNQLLRRAKNKHIEGMREWGLFIQRITVAKQKTFCTFILLGHKYLFSSM